MKQKQLSGWQRLSVVIGSVWLLFWFIAYMFDAQPFRWDGFMLFGAAPVVVFIGLPWAIVWVAKGFRVAPDKAH